MFKSRSCSEAQSNFYADCARLLQTPVIQEKVDLAYRLTQSPFLKDLQASLPSTDKEFQPGPGAMGKYPYDLKPVPVPLIEQLRKGLTRPLHFSIKSPWDIPKRPSLRSTAGVQHLIHSLAHIELSAVEVDVAMLLLFPHAPKKWILDWVSIIADEQRHFLLLCGLLKDLDMTYGDLPVHFGLWETALLGTTWLEMIAIVNRYQEASGVDASLELEKQLRQIQKQATAQVIGQIHHDEIRHVALGTRWWNWSFSHYKSVQRPSVNLQEEMAHYFFRVIEKHIRSPWRAGRIPLDIEGRVKCGFSVDELNYFKKLAAQPTQSALPQQESGARVDLVNHQAQ